MKRKEKLNQKVSQKFQIAPTNYSTLLCCDNKVSPINSHPVLLKNPDRIENTKITGNGSCKNDATDDIKRTFSAIYNIANHIRKSIILQI